jgi:hypothetical protein
MMHDIDCLPDSGWSRFQGATPIGTSLSQQCRIEAREDDTLKAARRHAFSGGGLAAKSTARDHAGPLAIRRQDGLRSTRNVRGTLTGVA